MNMPSAPTAMTAGRLRLPYTVSAPEVIMMAWIGTTGTIASTVRNPKSARYAHAGVAIMVNKSVIGRPPRGSRAHGIVRGRP
ncbi:hypothetical protein Ani05nite_36560 [Amorphoplanes nipponensis]|uniref:Uncharacterized protein n=1 Tax=Actinoplanes nipponensis TaxID=135950 RepID=A0A919MMQ1_9ACTN|nr:hypothetical protein Ani05nite_36560 [Actinoplanes nipponensis]